MKTKFRALFLVLATTLFAAESLSGEIANGIHIKPEKLALPANEQPYFGFLAKSVEQKAADQRFVEAVLSKGIARHQAAESAANAGWQSIMRQDWGTASKRFNQASLFDPSMSQIAHGFAIIVAERDRAQNYASELFIAAAKLKNPLPSLPADHARMLLMNRRPTEAIPLLQRAIEQTPTWEVPYSNLANAYFEIGKNAEACAALKKIPPNNNPDVLSDARRVASLAKC